MSVKIIENFINDAQCDWFLNFHKNNFPRKDLELGQEYHRDTEIFDCDLIAVKHEVKEFKYLLSKLNLLIKELDNESFINYSQIVKWPESSEQPSHSDFGYHPYTSILYLNDNFEGGETKVDKEIFKPKKGRLIIFEGNKLEHEVLKIKKGQRYTNATWYTKLF